MMELTVKHIEHYDTRVTVDDKNFIFSNPEEAEDMYNILSSMMRENALSSCEIDKLKREITKHMINNSVYVLASYNYDAEYILMISKEYGKVKKHFDKLVKESGNGKGYIIYKYTLDKYYPSNDSHAEAIDWICKDYDGQIKDLTKI